MTVGDAPAVGGHLRPSPGGGLGRSLRAELVKLRGTPSVWLLATLAVLGSLVGLVPSLVLQPISTSEDLRSLLSFASTGGLMVILLGLVVAAGEYRHGTIVPTALGDPGRARSFCAQMTALGVVGLLIGSTASAATVGITAAAMPLASDPPPLRATDVLAAAAGATVYTAVAAAVGGSIGALARNQVAAAIAMLVHLSMVDPLVAMALPGFGRFGPVALGIALGGASPDPSGGPGSQLLAPVVAGAVWLSYAATLATAALVTTMRRQLP